VVNKDTSPHTLMYNKNVFTSKDIISIIIMLSKVSCLPTHHINDLQKTNTKFYKKEVYIDSIFETHPEVKNTIMLLVDNPRYDEQTLHPSMADQPIIIFNGKLIDGYSRLSRSIINKKNTIIALIN